MTTCQIEEINAGRAYPKTCPTCGFAGKCRKGLPHPWLSDEPPVAAPTPIDISKIRVGDRVRLGGEFEVALVYPGGAIFLKDVRCEVPPEWIAEHIPAAQPIEVGDRVRIVRSSHPGCELEVLCISGEEAWIKCLSHGDTRVEHVSGLTRVDGEVA